MKCWTFCCIICECRLKIESKKSVKKCKFKMSPRNSTFLHSSSVGYTATAHFSVELAIYSKEWYAFSKLHRLRTPQTWIRDECDWGSIVCADLKAPQLVSYPHPWSGEKIMLLPRAGTWTLVPGVQLQRTDALTIPYRPVIQLCLNK